MQRLFVTLLFGFAVNCALPAAQAQYYPGYRPPVYPGYVNPYYPTPGQMYGSAEVMRAQGDMSTATEQARILREQANQAKIDTKRKAFDEMQYEKANTPTYLEELTKEKAAILTRLMNHPIKAEITDGKTLNVMLPLLDSLSSHGTQGPPVPLSQTLVNQLNVSNNGTSSVGIFRAGGQVDWPPSLRGAQQKKIDKLLVAAYDATVKNTLEPKLMKQVRTEMNTLRENMRQQLARDEFDAGSYMKALEFYHALENSVNALERPDARKQLAGAYSPRVRNVQELVDFMTENGVKFAPATPGDENAYQATHDAFVRYARTAQSSGGFASMNAPVSVGSKKK